MLKGPRQFTTHVEEGRSDCWNYSRGHGLENGLWA